jgi:hypothetical protein
MDAKTGNANVCFIFSQPGIRNTGQLAEGVNNGNENYSA